MSRLGCCLVLVVPSLLLVAALMLLGPAPYPFAFLGVVMSVATTALDPSDTKFLDDLQAQPAQPVSLPVSEREVTDPARVPPYVPHEETELAAHQRAVLREYIDHLLTPLLDSIGTARTGDRRQRELVSTVKRFLEFSYAELTERERSIRELGQDVIEGHAELLA